MNYDKSVYFNEIIFYFLSRHKSILANDYFSKRCDEWLKSASKPGVTDKLCINGILLSLFPCQLHQRFLVSIAYRQLHGSDHNRTFPDKSFCERSDLLQAEPLTVKIFYYFVYLLLNLKNKW